MAHHPWSRPRYPGQLPVDEFSALSAMEDKQGLVSPSHHASRIAGLISDVESDDLSSTGGLMSRSLSRSDDLSPANERDDASTSTLRNWQHTSKTFHMLSTTPESATEHSRSSSLVDSDQTQEQSSIDASNATTRTLRRTPRNRRIESPVPLSLDDLPVKVPPPRQRHTYSLSAALGRPATSTQDSMPGEDLLALAHKSYLSQLAEGQPTAVLSDAEQQSEHALQPPINFSIAPPATTSSSGFESSAHLHANSSAKGVEESLGPTGTNMQQPGANGRSLPPTQASTNADAQPCVNAEATSLRQADTHDSQHPVNARVPPLSQTVSHENHAHVDDQAPPARQTWRRSAYPLQMASPQSTTQSPLAPPPPQANQQGQANKQPTSQSRQNHQGGSTSHNSYQNAQTRAVTSSQTALPRASEIKASENGNKGGEPSILTNVARRPAYPLQSSASIPQLRGAASPAVSDRNASQSGKSFRRQGYPLQSPAFAADLEPPQAQSYVKSENRTWKAETQVYQSDEPIVRTMTKPARRQMYPLQSPASGSDLRKTQSQYPSQTGQHDESSTSNEAEKSSTEAIDNTKWTSAKIAQATHFPAQAPPIRRQKYPMQSPVSVADLRSTQGRILEDCEEEEDEQEIYEEPMSMSKPQSPSSMTSPKSPLWRRQTYPLQFVEDDSSTLQHSSNEPSLMDDDGEEEDDDDNISSTSALPSKILLPRHIPAVTSQRKAQSQGRTIVVCLDGTGDKFDSDNSNIVHIVSALKKDDPQQVTYYQAGIGTYSQNGLSKGFAAASDMAVGSGLGLHVRDAYHFLMHVYKENDRICIFGFSRGAYTARCLAGMIHKVGLLPPRNDQQIAFAYEFYKDNSEQGWMNSGDFKKAFCIDVNVHFLGCFDSVASVGFIPRQLPLSTTPTNKPRYFRHAMALDERRAKFKVCRHQRANWDNTKAHEESKSDEDIYRKEYHPNLTDEEYSRLSGPEKPFDTDVVEVWFAGAHADVGGGAVPNVERHKLAQIPLRWMIRQAFECNTGILFKSRILAEFGLDVHTLWPKYSRLKVPAHGPPPSFLEKYKKGLPPRSRRKSKLVPTTEQENGEQLYHLKTPWDDEWTPEQVEDFYDAMMPINDQLIQAPTWWILETIPVEYKVPIEPGKAITRFGMNMGQYRGVEDAEPKMHWTVKHRMEQLKYKIGARTAKHAKWRVVV